VTIEFKTADGTSMAKKKYKISAKVCPRWGFETTKPPEAITVKEGTVGMDRKWLHYIGDGDWVAAIESLLAQKAQVGDQARIRAWNLAVAVHKVDPKNARLAPLGPKFVAACHEIVDMFTTGPARGEGQVRLPQEREVALPGHVIAMWSAPALASVLRIY
jgi:hypothetical protein